MANYKSFKSDVDAAGNITTKYDTLADFIAALVDWKNKNPGHSSYAVNCLPYYFCGGSFLDAARVNNDALGKSITDFNDAARAVAEKLQEQYSTPENYNFDVTGESFDVAEVLSGRPECWFTLPEDKQKKLNIVYNTALSCHVLKSQIFNRGACLIGLIDALKAAGVNVSLIVVDYTYFRRFCISKKTILNIDLSIISPDSLRFICCNPLFLRRLSVYQSEILLHRQNLKSINYGTPLTYTPENIEDDTLIITDNFTPATIDDGARVLCNMLQDFKKDDDGAPRMLKI